MVTRNLNKVIDVNFYPVPEAKKSNMRHRPVGLGVQGLADAFIMVSRSDHVTLPPALSRPQPKPFDHGALWISSDLDVGQTAHVGS